MASKKILTDLEVVGPVLSSRFNIGNTDNYLRYNSGDLEIFSDGTLALETSDGVLIEISDVIEVVGNIEVDGDITANVFRKTGGTSSQFLKADGSVDSTTYTGNQDLSGYLLNTTDTLTARLTITSADVTSSQWDDVTGGINYASGDVGIGTTSPQAKLDVDGNIRGTASLIVKDTGGTKSLTLSRELNYATINNGTNTLNYNASNHIFLNGLAEKMRISSSGDVGIGTISPSAKLDVDGGIRMANDTTTASADNEGTMRYYTDAAGSYMDMVMQYQNSGNSANDYKWTNVVRHIFPS